MVAPVLKSRNRIKLFRSPSLERLTVISAPAFIALWAVLLPFIVGIGAASALSRWAPALIAGGVITWSVMEYALHRFVFHLRTDSELIRRVIFIIHGNHHTDPSDPLRNLMPPIISLPVCGAVWAMSLWSLGPKGTWFFLGFATGYVSYDLVHYACHQWPMKGRMARALKTHHMRHHHLGAPGNYAITGMIWDRILATRIISARAQD